MPAARCLRRLSLVVAAVWLVWILLVAEEPRSLARIGSWPSAEWLDAAKRGRALRVVSLNCAGGNAAAAAEAANYRPDIVVLQESPAQKDIENLGRRLFGSNCGVVRGVDTSVISRWPAEPVELPRKLRLCCVWARVRLPGGERLDCLSVRLTPPVFRLDAWRPECWRSYAADRRERRQQVRAIAECIGKRRRKLPIVVGGDMNAPGGDGALREFGSSLRDAFFEGGRGLCNTVLNDCPVLRFDQVWIGGRLRACAVMARKTRHSDHRLVICDLILE